MAGSRLLRERVFQTWTWCLLLLAATVPAASSDDVLSEESLAKASIQTIAAQSDRYAMTANVAVNGYQAPQIDSLANYARGADGQWQIPQQVDRANPWVRLLLLAPEKPVLIDLAIYLDGQPFTAAREGLIDNLMDHATVESLVREAVEVPLPQESEGESKAEEKNKEEPEKEDESESDGSDTESASDQSQDNDSPDADGSAKDDGADQKGKEKKEPEKPMVEVKQRKARTVAQRLVNYMASSEVKADREEIRWLLAEWTGGPAILTLGPAMSWQRVGIAPLWNALDVDGDDNLNAAEVTAASERLAQADVDENSIIELEELFAVKPHSTTAPHSYPLVVVLDHETDWRQLGSHLQTAYSRRGSNQQGLAVSTSSAIMARISQGDASLTANELEALLEEASDIRLRVSLGNTSEKDEKEKAQNELALLSASFEKYAGTEKMITLVGGADYIEISAGESQEKEISEPVATQVSIGAVVDGYPLFRLADRNGDRRLSPRECRNLKNVLSGIDLDGDGQISQREKPSAIRVAVTRGPHVHEMLAEPTSGEREFARATSDAASAPAKPAPQAPAWFTDMDRNRDGDVSRSEFLGTSEQFKQLDRDGDGLIGSQEATN